MPILQRDQSTVYAQNARIWYISGIFYIIYSEIAFIGDSNLKRKWKNDDDSAGFTISPSSRELWCDY